jgi:hypothetical protein
LYWVNSNFIQGLPAERLLRHDPVVNLFKSDTSRYRVFGLPGTFEGISTRYHGIETVDGFADHEMRHYRALRGNDYQNNPGFMAGLRQNPDGSVAGSVILDMLNVKYVAFRVPNDPGIKVVPNATVVPRAIFVPQWRAVTDSQAFHGIQEAGFDPRRFAYVTAPGMSSGGAPADSGAGLVIAGETLRRYNRQAYVVDAPTQGVLVLSELWFPHWRVKVDGVSAPLLRVNFAFRGVQLPPGRHTVEISYHSPWIRTGMLVSGATMVCLVLIGLLGRRGRLRPRVSNP